MWNWVWSLGALLLVRFSSTMLQITVWQLLCTVPCVIVEWIVSFYRNNNNNNDNKITLFMSPSTSEIGSFDPTFFFFDRWSQVFGISNYRMDKFSRLVIYYCHHLYLILLYLSIRLTKKKNCTYRFYFGKELDSSMLLLATRKGNWCY